MDQDNLIPHLFRTEFSKITAVLCKHFGMTHIEIAEDIASDTFVAALETWPYKGIPPQPTAWLYTVARNKARNYLQRDQLFAKKIAADLRFSNPGQVMENIDLSAQNITDSQLQMIFAVCHPAVPSQAQVGLALRVLCGFGIEEIANAFLTSKDTIAKRLARAKEKLRSGNISIDFPAEQDVGKRLQTVLQTLYLLFNEGYYSESDDTVLRKDLCLEAMRLNYLLVENPRTNTAEANALMALMCFHASRFAARISASGEMVLYNDQDINLWNRELIAKGAWYLKTASTGNKFSKYHLEASIAWWHTVRADTAEKWESILELFDQLVALDNSPVIALNRLYALAKVRGKEAAITEAEKLAWTTNRYYHALLGELYTGIDDPKAEEHYCDALELAVTRADRNALEKQLKALRGIGPLHPGRE